MANKTSKYPVTGFDYRWGENRDKKLKPQTPDGLPHSGEQVRDFLGGKYAEVSEQIKSLSVGKAGAWTVVDNKLYVFDSTEKRDQFEETLDVSLLLEGFSPIELGHSGSASIDFRVNVDYAGDFYINGSNAFNVPVYVKSIIIEDGKESVYDTMANLELLVTLNGRLTTHSLGRVEANKTINVNVTPYVADGASVRFRAYNDSGNNRTTAQMWMVIRANMQATIASDSWWATPYRQGSAWVVPLRLNINVACNLKASLIDAEGVVRSTDTIPSSSLGENYELTLPHPSEAGGESGMYTFRLELYSNEEALASLASTQEYKVVCLNAGSTDSYLIINNEGKAFRNYTTNRMFDYAVVGAGNPKLSIVVKEGAKDVSSTGELALTANTKYSYNLSLEMERIDDRDFYLDVTATLLGGNIYTKKYTFSNSDGYAAASGATMLIRMGGRNNAEVNRDQFINIMTGSAVRPEITGVSWSNADGHYIAQDGTESFRMLSGGKMVLPIKPLAMLAGESRVMEFDFKVSNILDYSAPVIQCKEERADGTFYGMEITPTSILVRSASATVDDNQIKNFDGTERNHVLVMVRGLRSGVNKNVDNYPCVQIFINGSLNRTFAINNDINIDSQLVIGSDSADIDIYALRTYERSLSKMECESNTTNWKPDDASKEAFRNRNNVRENGKVDINKVKTMCNVIVFKTEGGILPTKDWAKTDSVKADVSMFFRDHPDWNWVNENVDLAWQGTTSHSYLRQNFKWSAASKFDFDGGLHKPIKKVTAKKNYASSMQSHKIGSVMIYTDLAVKCGIIEEGERLSIFQYPAVGFLELPDGSYQFIGLYTVGPDKGDSGTRGITDESVTMEALDNEPKASNFLLPMNDDTYTTDGETYKFYDVNSKGEVAEVKSWEDSSKNQTLVEEYWKPSFNFVYGCSQQVKHWSGTVEELNASSDADKGTAYWLTSADGDTPAFTQFYYNYKFGEWREAGINVRAQLANKGLGVSYADFDNATDFNILNEKVKKARVNKFKAEAEANGWSIQAAIFLWCFMEFIGAKDNRTKNSYPCIRKCGEGYKIIWWNDDLDTIFDINNIGLAIALYCIEVMDDYSMYGRPAQAVFNGINNQFWVLLELAFADEIFDFMQKKFMPALHYGQTGTPMQMVMQCFEHYYFDNAQNHFPEALYNEDARYCYEEGYLMGNSYEYSGISLSQCLGNHLSAERYWIKMRYIYMASKYNVDSFALGNTGDVFLTRPYNPGDGKKNAVTITPAIYMYPSIQEGNTKITRGDRIFPGNPSKSWTAEFEPAETSDQEQRINGMSYIRSLGAMYKNAFTNAIDVNGRMLTELQLGTRTDVANIRSVISGVVIGDATSLRLVDMANLGTLKGIVDLSQCVNLREVYGEGTGVTQVSLCDGGNLEVLHLPDTLTNLSLRNKKYLRDLVLNSLANLTSIEAFRCSDYAMEKVLDILEELYMTPYEKLEKYGAGIWTKDGQFYATAEQWEEAGKPEAFSLRLMKDARRVIDVSVETVGILYRLWNGGIETMKEYLLNMDTPESGNTDIVFPPLIERIYGDARLWKAFCSITGRDINDREFKLPYYTYNGIYYPAILSYSAGAQEFRIDQFNSRRLNDVTVGGCYKNTVSTIPS